jgi:hypothetical protein
MPIRMSDWSLDIKRRQIYSRAAAEERGHAGHRRRGPRKAAVSASEMRRTGAEEMRRTGVACTPWSSAVFGVDCSSCGRCTGCHIRSDECVYASVRPCQLSAQPLHTIIKRKLHHASHTDPRNVAPRGLFAEREGKGRKLRAVGKGWGKWRNRGERSRLTLWLRKR